MARRDQVRDALVEGGVVQKKDRLISQIVLEVEYALYPPKHEQEVPCRAANESVLACGSNPVTGQGRAM